MIVGALPMVIVPTERLLLLGRRDIEIVWRGSDGAS